jgi:hypothetical protein
MFNMEGIAELKRDLEQAALDARPVIVETVKGTKDEKVQINKTSGTVRVDLKGAWWRSCSVVEGSYVVPETGIEPVRAFWTRGILSPLRLPIPPLRQEGGF